MRPPKPVWSIVLLLAITVLLTHCGAPSTEVAPTQTSVPPTPAEAKAEPTTPPAAPAEPTTPPAAPTQAEPVTLKIIETSEAHGYALQKLAPKYEEMTGTKVVVEIFPYDATYEKEVLMFSTGGSDYDLVAFDCIWAPLFQENGWLLDIAPYMNDPDLPDIKLDEFIPGLADYWDVVGDAVYGIPHDYTAVILAYRTDLFEEAGIPGPPQTWEEFHEYAKRLTKDTDGDGKIDQYGFIWHGGIPDSAYGDWIVRVQGFKLPEDQIEHVLNAEATETRFMKYPYGVKALQALLDSMPYAPEGAVGWGYGESIQNFTQGVGAMYLDWQVMFSEFNDPEKSAIAGKVAFAVPPTWEEKNYVVGGWHLAINKFSKHPEEAYKFLAWIASDEGQKAMIEAGSLTPYKKFVFESEEYTSKYPVFVPMGQIAEGRTFGAARTKHFVEMQQILFEQLQAAFTGQKSAEEALQQAAIEIDALLQE